MQVNSFLRKSPLQLAHSAVDTAVASYGALTGGATDTFGAAYVKPAGMISAGLHGASAIWHVAQAAEAYNAHVNTKGKDEDALPDCRAHCFLGAADLMSVTGVMSALSGSTVFGPAMVAAGTATKLIAREVYFTEETPKPAPALA